MSNPETEPLQCMEVWGGNCAVERKFETAGLRIWAFSRPFEQAKSGGDVYYLSSCASGRITRMLLADVSGHGQRVAAVATSLRDLMRRNINTIKQTRFVSAMNRQFAELNDGQNFATALVTTFFAPTKTLALCNAGHPPPLIYRQKTDSWRELVATDNASAEIADTPLGVANEAVYGQLNVVLEPGELVLSFSDSVSESESAAGEQLGAKGVLRLVSTLGVAENSEIIPALVAQITAMNDRNLKQDDTTILLIEATGTGATWKNNLLAPLRLMRAAGDNTQLRN
jgi:serine phosphatase RsbU (regulator of sigma subunit)